MFDCFDLGILAVSTFFTFTIPCSESQYETQSAPRASVQNIYMKGENELSETLRHCSGPRGFPGDSLESNLILPRKNSRF
jgi:hypothetical protein